MIFIKIEAEKLIEFSIPDNYENIISQDINDKKLERTIIHFDKINKSILVRSAIGNPVPLFWFWRDRKFVISDNLSRVAIELKEAQKLVFEDIDEIALIESMLFDCPLVDRTFFKKIKKTQMGEEFIFNLTNGHVDKKWLWLPSIQSGENSSDALIKERAKELLVTLIDDVPYIDEIVLPLTGGLDSRLLAALFKLKRGSKINAYTFQRGWSVETWCAKKLAKSIGASHQTINLDDRCYKIFSYISSIQSGGMVPAMHTHGIYCCDQILAPAYKTLPRVFGYFGDPITGAMTENPVGAIASSPELLDKYNKTIFPEAVKKFRQEILFDLDQTFSCYKNSGSKDGTFHEFWKIQQRQNGLITHLFNYHRAIHNVTVIEPFIKRDFIDFFLGLPFPYRFDRGLFKSLTKEIFPREFSLPSMHFQNGSAMHKVEQFFELAEKAVNKINLKQELFLNPFKYEQHEKNLMNYLIDEIDDGRLMCEEILGVKGGRFGFPLWKFNTTAKEGYRLVMINQLLKTS